VKIYNELIDYTLDIPEAPRRIVSLNSGFTEALFAMGCGDRVVGVSSYCDRYVDIADRPVVGDYLNFDTEKLDALEPFHPDRIASRILGMGDVVSLVEQAQETVDADKAKALADKVRSGKGFTLEDMRDQFGQMLKMGGMGGLMDKLPGMGKLGADAQKHIDDKDIKRMMAIIDSMTPGERQRPDIIKGSRKRRIANGSGMQVQDVNRLLKQYRDMRDMMKKLSGGGMKKMMRGMKGRMPGLPF